MPEPPASTIPFMDCMYLFRLFVFYSIHHLTCYEQKSHGLFLGEGGSIGG